MASSALLTVCIADEADHLMRFFVLQMVDHYHNKADGLLCPLKSPCLRTTGTPLGGMRTSNMSVTRVGPGGGMGRLSVHGVGSRVMGSPSRSGFGRGESNASVV